MNRYVAALAVSALGCLALPLSPTATFAAPAGPMDAPPAPSADLVPGLLVKYEPGAVPTPAAGQPLPGAVAKDLGLTAGAPVGLGWVAAQLPKQLPADQVEQYARRLEADPTIAIAEPQAIARPSDAAPTPNDPFWNQQWGFAAYGDDTFISPYDHSSLGREVTGTNLLPALGAARGSAPVVAVIDTGITNHPDLGGRVLPGYNFISNPATAGNATGRGPDATDTGDWVTPQMAASLPFSLIGCLGVRRSNWHGTHVAGTIASVTDNGLGGAGTLPVQIQPIRVLGHCGGTVGDVAAGMIWAAGGTVPGVPDNPTPARVVNLSLGWQGECPQYIQEAINFGRSKGTVFVTSAGNSNADAANYAPANCAGVITATATDTIGGRALFSNYGSTVDVAAPGVEVVSTFNDGATTPSTPGYAVMSGTSMSAAHVSGALAMLLATAPALSPDQIEARLKSSATPFKQASFYQNPALDCVGDDPCGAGYLNTAALVGQATAPAPVIAPRFQVRAATAAAAAAAAGAAAGEGVDVTVTYQPPGGAVTDYHVVVASGGTVLAERDTAATTLALTVPGAVDDPFTVTVTPRRAGTPGVATAAMLVPSLAPAVPPAPQVAWVSAADTTARVTVLSSYAVPEVTEVVVTMQPGGEQCTLRPFPTWGYCDFGQLTPGDEYTFTAVARNAVGDSATSAPYAATAEAFGTPGAPGVPVVTMQNTTANIEWTPATPASGRQITNYVVEAQPSVGPLQSCKVDGYGEAPLPACQLGNLEVGQTYTFIVTAFDDLGKRSESPESLPVQVGGTATVPSAPNMPPEIMAGDGMVGAMLIPGAVSDFNGGAPMIAMRILASPGGASCDIAWDDVLAGLISGTGSYCLIGGLTNGQPYRFTSVGINAQGASAPSNASTEFTPNPAGSEFQPLPVPVRAFDSRQQGGPIPPDTPRTIDLQAPPGAVAVAYNVTVTGTTTTGNAAVGPAGASLTGTSAINWFGPGQTLANGYVAKLGDGADLQVVVRGGSANVILDVLGYYLPPGFGIVPTAEPDQLVFVPLDPGTRVYDSRTADGPLLDGTSRTVSLATGVPAGAQAAAYTITEFDTVGSGHLSVGLPGSPKPPTSTINWFANGQRLANSTVAALDDQRALAVFGGGPATGFAIDVLGYFTTAAQAPDGLRFQPIAPARAYDSRDANAGGLLLAGQRRTTNAAPIGQLAARNAAAVAVNLTVADTVAGGHLRLAPGETAVRPETSAINWYASGQRLANGTVVAIRDGKMTTFSGSGATQYIVDMAGYYFRPS